MTKAFDKIAAGLADAIAFAEGDKSKGRIVHHISLGAEAVRRPHARGAKATKGHPVGDGGC